MGVSVEVSLLVGVDVDMEREEESIPRMNPDAVWVEEGKRARVL